MFFALLILPLMIWFHLHGSTQISTRLSLLHLDYMNPFKGVGIMSILSLLGWGLGYFGQPHILVRFMAARTSKHMGIARNVCMIWMVLCLIGSVLIGLFGAALYAHSPLSKPETVFLRSAVSLFTPAVAGILLAAVLSAIMSTISAQLLVCSSVLIEDIYGRLFNTNLSNKQGLKLNRVAVLVIALTALLLALDPKNSVLGLVSYAWAGLGAAFGPVILFSLYWDKITRNGALLGIILGGLTVVLWKSLASLGGIFHLYELIPGFILCCFGIYLGSLYDIKRRPLKKSMIEQHKLFLTKLSS